MLWITGTVSHPAWGEWTLVRVRVARADGHRIRVEVADPARQALPVSLPGALDAENGRGLALLDAAP